LLRTDFTVDHRRSQLADRSSEPFRTSDNRLQDRKGALIDTVELFGADRAGLESLRQLEQGSRCGGRIAPLDAERVRYAVSELEQVLLRSSKRRSRLSRTAIERGKSFDLDPVTLGR